jgi:hypothetical protein
VKGLELSNLLTISIINIDKNTVLRDKILNLPGNIQKAKEIFSEGCFLASARSCSSLGMILKKEGAKDDAKELLHRACDLGNIFGCKKYQLIKR